MTVIYNYIVYLYCFFSIALVGTLNAEQTIKIASIDIANTSTPHLILHVDTPSGDLFYADYFSFSVDHPDVIVLEPQFSIEPIKKYDVTFKITKNIFNKPFSIILPLQITSDNIASCNLCIGYYQQSKKQTHYSILPLELHKLNAAAQNKTYAPITKPTINNSFPKKTTSSPIHSSNYFSTLLQSTDSFLLQLFLALLLGFLLSLTPCIYPMIPITMGILQSQGSISMQRNFMLSLTYTTGIATTFALLGTIAAFSGKLFGSFMNNPLVILGIVVLLAYLAGSMLGMYELYIPQFLQPKHQSVKGGSLFSVFMFGAISGTVASPCLSPGLLLLLTLVTNAGNVIVGFVLLFAFGLGLGIPLLIIGTFSGSLNMLPRAGIWMVDIKQLFGFILLGTCFYFLKICVPLHILSWAFAFFITAVGIFYLKAAHVTYGINRHTKNFLGIILIACATYAYFYSYKVTDISFNPQASFSCFYDFQEAECHAQQCKTLLLLDVSAPYCSICKAIDQKLFTHDDVIACMKTITFVKIDDLDKNENTRSVQQQFNILGAPTFILWDPVHKKELYRWGAELYDHSAEDFIAMIQKYQEK